MSGNGNITPWIFVAVIGVLAILFAVFGLQQRSEGIAAKAELEQMKMHLQIATNRAAEYEKRSVAVVKVSMEREKVLIGKLEECMKGKKR